MVPAAAPAGTYTLAAFVGTYPDIDDSDSFPFTKAAGPLAGSEPAEATAWRLEERLLEERLLEETMDAPALHVTASPNPTGGAVTFTFSLDAPAEVTLAVYDALGRRVAVLAEEVADAGRHVIPFDPARAGLPNGVYLYRLQRRPEVAAGRLVLAR